MSQTFKQFAESFGLKINSLRSDGSIHRVPTIDKPTRDNGAYQFYGDRGWVQNWAQADEVNWWQDESAKPWTEAEKADADRKRREQARERAKKAAAAARKADAMLRSAQLVTPRPGRAWRPGRPAVEPVPAHPYFVKKGFPEESGYILDGELLIPMRDCTDNSLVGLQTIDQQGKKLYLAGQRADLAVYTMGAGTGVWLVEGFATGLSVHLALRALYRKDPVVVCFSAGNLRKVAARGIGEYVMADNDESQTGEEAALATGLPWTMPSTRGWDANDLHLNAGIFAVRQLVADCIMATQDRKMQL